jgi:glycine dehydrogenase subunit 2
MNEMILARLIFEKSAPGKQAWVLPPTEVPEYSTQELQERHLLRTVNLGFPELSEPDVVRHYINLSARNYGVDSGLYPLGSCTMKYNPKINENLARLSEFQEIHPLMPPEHAQGSLAIMHQLEQCLTEITGMDYFTLQPAAGAHGELTALLIIRQYFRDKGATGRTKILIPTSAHGTNPASAMMAGFETVPVNCNVDGRVDLNHLQSLLNEESIRSSLAALMLTNPNTLGLFETEIEQIGLRVHGCGGLLYYDGANFNAIMGLVRPGDMGFDLIHLNLHKTFATPHGGGGPGAGPVGVKSFLADYLPVPVLAKNEHGLYWNYDRPQSIGKVSGFYGNFAVLLKALAYINALGGDGLAQVSQDAVINANYLRVCLGNDYQIAFDCICMHEFVLSVNNLPNHIRALDIAKRLMDFGIHPPTIYFPLIVPEALMIEPTETEDKATLDNFIAIMTQIHREVQDSPEIFSTAPRHTPVTRVDEAKAARSPKLRYLK